MNILLSAYACEPHKGSEPGVGWHWADELALAGHEVWVITRSNNQAPIEAAMSQWEKDDPRHERLHFVYVDLPPWCQRVKKACLNLTYHLYYLLWQWAAFLKAKLLLKEHPIDRVQHVTYVSIRQPSLMGCLGIPFIFGPVAGGDEIPPALRKTFPLHRQIREGLRGLVNHALVLDPLMHLTFATATEIYAASEQTRQLIPSFYRHKCQIQLAIGTDPKEEAIIKEAPPITVKSTSGNEQPFKVLYVGQLLYLKGIHLALAAWPQVLQACPDTNLTLIGEGEDQEWLQQLAQTYQIQDRIDWQPWMPRNELLQHYQDYDLFLFPSLRDSGGMVVLEALQNQLPVICFNLGGPGVIVDSSCGLVINAQEKPEVEVVKDLAQGIITAIETRQTEGWRPQTQHRAQQFQWNTLVQRLYTEARTE